MVRKNFLKFSLFQGVYSEGGYSKKKSKSGKKIEDNKEEYVLEEKRECWMMTRTPIRCLQCCSKRSFLKNFG